VRTRIAATVLLISSLGGCTIPLRTPPAGVLAANFVGPVGVTNDSCSGIPHHSAKSYSVLGLVAWGDASIENARTVLPSGFRLSRLATIDYRRRQYFGVGSFETVVCGFFVQHRAVESIQLAGSPAIEASGRRRTSSSALR
jgi:hypothetical protein